MKRWLLAGVVLLIIAVIGLLGQPIEDPENFAGEWYSTSNQSIYRFEDGIIHCETHSVLLSDGSAISGAYSYSGRTLALFALGIDSLEDVKELYLIENRDGTFLCERKDGTGETYFVRRK